MPCQLPRRGVQQYTFDTPCRTRGEQLSPCVAFRAHRSAQQPGLFSLADVEIRSSSSVPPPPPLKAFIIDAFLPWFSSVSRQKKGKRNKRKHVLNQEISQR